MNFKIENNYLNISNYPYIERHFEKMARKGWLISKIIIGNIFIYKKIEPEELDFSISPYEVETTFTRKTKEELEEFQSVCKTVGWNYATKSYDLHIYFKKKGSEAIAIQTDEEEEFKTLEIMGKRYLKGQYIQIPLFILLAWMNISGIFSNIYSMKNGLVQVVSLLIPIGIILGILGAVDLREFLKKNKGNIGMGKSIEYNNSKLYIYKTCYSLFYISTFIFVIYSLYSALVLKNKIIAMAFIPILIGAFVGVLYRIFIKPSKKSLSYKKIAFGMTLLVATILPIGTGVFNIGMLASEKSTPDIGGYRVLSVNDFADKDIEDDGDLLRNASILIPESYEYTSFIRGNGYIRTEYSDVLNESLAKSLVNRYKKQAENSLIGSNSEELRYLFEEGVYDSYIYMSGFNEEDFNSLKRKKQKEAVDRALTIIKERSIREDKENLWNADEAYFLDYQRDEIVLRKGKEVFYLEGKDFSDPEIIKISKYKLELN